MNSNSSNSNSNNNNNGSNCNSIARLKSNQNIQVYIRVRPPNERERLLRSIDMVHTPSQKEITVRQTLDSKMTKKFTFDRTFGQNSTQHEVYSSVVAPLIEEVISGYNCTVFAYGQTGTGKTHTMIGDETPSIGSSYDDTTDVGIIPRALSHLFDELRLMEVEFSMRISFLELYNEELSDLLSSSDNTQIRIFDDANKKGSIIVQGLEEIPVHSTSDVYKLLAKGQEKRKTATTLMNAQSSRSHTIFSILVHIKENGLEGDELLKIGKLNLVDLAGSENITKAGNEKGIRTRETVNINQSLLTLGRVITALVERTPHIPYRESKLTRLLQESLGGRTKTSIIATISPGHKDLEETLNTLEYAHRAKHIQNKPEVNQKLTKKAVIKEYTEEIDRLKRDLMAARDKNGIYLAEDTYIDMQYKMETQSRELNEKMLLLKALKDDLASKQRLFNEISLCLVERTEELKVKENVLEETKTVLGKTKKDLRCTKRRYQEKKHLLENHIRTEHELTGQAYQLKDVANCATSDTYKLHETIERRQTVENQSNEAINSFRDDIHLFLNTVQTKLDTINTEFQFNSQTIQSEIDNHIIEHKTFSDTSIADLNNFIKFNETATTVVSDEYLKKYENLLVGMTGEQQWAIHKMLNDCVLTERSYQTKFAEQIAEQRLKLNIEKNSIDDHSSKVSEQITKITKIHEEFCNRITDTLKQQTNSLLKQLEDNQCLVQKSINRNKTIETDFKNIIDQMQMLLKNTEENNAELEMVIPKFKHFENDIQQYNTTELQSIDKHRKNYDEHTAELNNTFKDVHCTTAEHFIANELFINQCSQLNDENSVKIIESIHAIEKETAKQTNQLRDTVRQNTTDIQSQLKANEITANKNCSKLIESINAESVQCENYALGNSSLNNLLVKSMETFHMDSSTEIVRCYDSIDNFYSNKLKSYTSTGDTPIRKKYDFPQKIIATSPHNRLLQRFRATNQDLSMLDCSSITISEDSSQDNENETFACTTTPSQSLLATPNDIENITDQCENDNIPVTMLENNNFNEENSPIELNINNKTGTPPETPAHTILSERINFNNYSADLNSKKKIKGENALHQVINNKENVSG